MGSYDVGGILNLAREYTGGLRIAPYENALSASWFINLGLSDGGAGLHAFYFIVCFALDLVVLLFGISLSPKFVSSIMKLPSG